MLKLFHDKIHFMEYSDSISKDNQHFIKLIFYSVFFIDIILDQSIHL